MHAACRRDGMGTTPLLPLRSGARAGGQRSLWMEEREGEKRRSSGDTRRSVICRPQTRCVFLCSGSCQPDIPVASRV